MNFKGKSIKHWLFITSWALVLYFETLYSTEMIKEIFNVYISHVWGVLIVTVGLISPMHSGVWDVKASELSWKNALFPVAVVIAVILLI
ncbi:hypothetical protein, partial [Oleiphilus sp. HI0066]|uniref:hypothetical protein n=2 Tax=Oleiphilus TaxID=141450 RepID=UPI000A8EB841